MRKRVGWASQVSIRFEREDVIAVRSAKSLKERGVGLCRLGEWGGVSSSGRCDRGRLEWRVSGIVRERILAARNRRRESRAGAQGLRCMRRLEIVGAMTFISEPIAISRKKIVVLCRCG